MRGVISSAHGNDYSLCDYSHGGAEGTVWRPKWCWFWVVKQLKKLKQLDFPQFPL